MVQLQLNQLPAECQTMILYLLLKSEVPLHLREGSRTGNLWQNGDYKSRKNRNFEFFPAILRVSRYWNNLGSPILYSNNLEIDCFDGPEVLGFNYWDPIGSLTSRLDFEQLKVKALKCFKSVSIRIRASRFSQRQAESQLAALENLFLSMHITKFSDFDQLILNFETDEWRKLSSREFWDRLWMLRYLRCKNLVMTGISHEATRPFQDLLASKNSRPSLPKQALDFWSWLEMFAMSQNERHPLHGKQPFDLSRDEVSIEQRYCIDEGCGEEDHICELTSFRIKMYEASKSQDETQFAASAKHYHDMILRAIAADFPVGIVDDEGSGALPSEGVHSA